MGNMLESRAMSNIAPNPPTSFQPSSRRPRIYHTAFVHPLAAVIGDVEIGPEVMVAPGASIRADEGGPFFIGGRSNVQDGVVIRALETFGPHSERNTVEVGGLRYAVYVGERVSLSPQAMLQGPCLVEEDSFIGAQALVFRSRVGCGSVVEPCSRLVGVIDPPERYVPAGSCLSNQAEADRLPRIDERYQFRAQNAEAVRVNTELVRAYLGQRQGRI